MRIILFYFSVCCFVSHCNILVEFTERLFYFTPDRGAEYYDNCVWLSFCLSVCP